MLTQAILEAVGASAAPSAVRRPSSLLLPPPPVSVISVRFLGPTSRRLPALQSPDWLRRSGADHKKKEVRVFLRNRQFMS